VIAAPRDDCDVADSDEFYEDDEPVDSVIRAFHEGEKGMTERGNMAPPSSGSKETSTPKGV